MKVIEMDRINLRTCLESQFSIDDLKSICFRLGIDHERFNNVNKPAFVRELIEYSERTGQFNKLALLCQETQSPPNNSISLRGCNFFASAGKLVIKGGFYFLVTIGLGIVAYLFLQDIKDMLSNPEATPTPTMTVMPTSTLPIVEATEEPMEEPTEEPIEEPTEEPMEEPTEEALEEAVPEASFPEEPTRRPCDITRPSNWELYRVVEGDTLSELAQATDTSTGFIMEMNCMTTSLLEVGQEIWLPKRIPTPIP